MPDENTITPAAPVAAPASPAPAEVSPFPAGVERLSVPASAVFDDTDAEPIAKPEKPVIDAAPVKPAEPVKPADAAPVTKPGESAKPTETPAKPGEPAKPAAPAAPAKTEAKVKVGDKEYTVAELEKLISNPPAKPAAPAPAPAKPAETPAAPKQPTPEEIQAQKSKQVEEENTWVANFNKGSQAKVNFNEQEVETILEGGKPAAELLSKKISDVVGRVVLETRQSIYNDINPYFAAANAAMTPILEQQARLDQIATEQVFVQRHADFPLDYLPKAREVAAALVEQYPDQVSQMTREQFTDEVAAQTDRVLQGEYKQFHPQATDTWRDAYKAAKAPAAPAAAPAAAPVVPPVPPVAAPAPAPAVRPPAANSPSALPAGGNGLTPDQNWHKQTAASLVD